MTVTAYEVTNSSINDILGVHATDLYYDDLDRKRDGFYDDNAKHTKSHCHPFGSQPINKLSFERLYMIICNYDADRNRSKVYLQAGHAEDAIDYLVHELAYAAIKILESRTTGMQDLVMLTNAISTSKYLAKMDGMEQLLELGCRQFNEAVKAEAKTPSMTK